MKYKNSKGKDQPFRIRKIGKEITKKKTFAKNTWYNLHGWLIKYVPDPIKTKGGSKDKIMSNIKMIKTKSFSEPTHVKKCMVEERNRGNLKCKINLKTKSLKL